MQVESTQVSWHPRIMMGLLALVLPITGMGCADPSAGDERGSGSPTATGPGTTTSMGTAATSTTGTGTQGDAGDSSSTGGPGPQTLMCDNLREFPITNVGCSFALVDSPTSYGGLLPLGVGLVNPGGGAATVVIEDFRGMGGSVREIATVTLTPGQAQLVKINGINGVLTGEDHGVAVGLNPDAAFHVRSTAPIAAVQFQPGAHPFSSFSAASLLIPRHALGEHYIYSGGVNSFQEKGALVVAVSDGTEVTTPAGTETLNAFDVLFVEDVEDVMEHYEVTSDKPIAVFSSTAFAQMGGGVDTLEEQLIPTNAWGHTYVAARHAPRLQEYNDTIESVHWRLIAGEDDVTVTLDPPHPVEGATVELAQAGDMIHLVTDEHFVATADAPFMLLQYMVGTEELMLPEPLGSAAITGGPTVTHAVPVTSWTPDTWTVTNFAVRQEILVITRPAGVEVNVECLGLVDDDSFVGVGDGAYEVAYVELDTDGFGGEGDCIDGPQHIRADVPITATLFGLDSSGAYAFATAFGGLRAN